MKRVYTFGQRTDIKRFSKYQFEKKMNDTFLKTYTHYCMLFM